MRKHRFPEESSGRFLKTLPFSFHRLAFLAIVLLAASSEADLFDTIVKFGEGLGYMGLKQELLDNGVSPDDIDCVMWVSEQTGIFNDVKNLNVIFDLKKSEKNFNFKINFAIDVCKVYPALVVILLIVLFTGCCCCCCACCRQSSKPMMPAIILQQAPTRATRGFKPLVEEV